MANQWLRLWHDMPNDPKFRTIARASGQPVSAVLAVYVHLLVNASNATERGRTHGIANEDLASALDLDTTDIDKILDAMQGRVLDGDRLTGWKSRQPEREDGASERSKRWREARKAEQQTQSNANERNRTLDKDKDKDTEKAKSTALVVAKPRPSKRAPVDFTLTTEMLEWAWAEAPGVNVTAETAKFMDHTFATAKTDWMATWRNWIRKATPITAAKPKPVLGLADQVMANFNENQRRLGNDRND